MSWITSEDRGSIRWLTLSNPGKKNAVPSQGWEPLREAFEDFESSGSRVLVLTGEGGEFCAGAELDADFVAGGSVIIRRHRHMKQVAAAATALHRITKPTIAAVDGVAVGAGMNMALGCDVVVATSRTRFSEIFVKRGLSLDFGGTWLLPRIVGLQRAKELAMSGRIIESEEALRLGLCLEVVDAPELSARVQELAETFLEGAPVAQMFAKQGIHSGWETSFEEALGWEGQSQSICAATEDFAEGVAAFHERRPPDFRGR